MFQGSGEYYCINGCFSYPLNPERINKLIENLPAVSRVERIECYHVSSEEFSYEKAMNDEYSVVEGSFPLSDRTMPISMDFFCGKVSCRLQVELLDEKYYGISLVYHQEEKIEEKQLWKMKEDEYDLFSENFYIDKLICNRMSDCIAGNKKMQNLSEGIYFSNQSKRKYKRLFSEFLKTVCDWPLDFSKNSASI